MSNEEQDVCPHCDDRGFVIGFENSMRTCEHCQGYGGAIRCKHCKQIGATNNIEDRYYLCDNCIALLS